MKFCLLVVKRYSHWSNLAQLKAVNFSIKKGESKTIAVCIEMIKLGKSMSFIHLGYEYRSWHSGLTVTKRAESPNKCYLWAFCLNLNKANIWNTERLNTRDIYICIHKEFLGHISAQKPCMVLIFSKMNRVWWGKLVGHYVEGPSDIWPTFTLMLDHSISS